MIKSRNFHGKSFPALLILSVALFLLAASVSHLSAGDSSGMVLGKRTWQEWQKETGWSPVPDGQVSGIQSKLDRLSQLQRQKDASFYIFGGSWCPDTEGQLPMIMKILERASIPAGRISIYGVNHEKAEPTGTAKAFSIERVPTVVILVKGKEIGRVVEFPEVDWAEDIIRILSR